MTEAKGTEVRGWLQVAVTAVTLGSGMFGAYTSLSERFARLESEMRAATIEVERLREARQPEKLWAVKGRLQVLESRMAQCRCIPKRGR